MSISKTLSGLGLPLLMSLVLVEPALADVLCASKSNGTLAVRSKCRTSENRVLRRASLRGPRGLRGATGRPGPTGATGTAGSTGTTGPSGTIKVTTLRIDTSVGWLTSGSVLRIHNFPDAIVKTSATSILKVTFSGHARLQAPANGAAFFCFLQVRMNDVDSNGGASGVFDQTATGSLAYGSDAGMAASAFLPTAFSTVGIFTGLAAGTHSPSVYGGSQSGIGVCRLNPGPFSAFLVVEEIEPATS